MSAWRTAAERCSRVPDTNPGECSYCGTDLPRRKDGQIHKGRTSCSGKCAHAFAREHDWKMARDAAVKRDGGKCVTCGAGPGVRPERPAYMDPSRTRYGSTIYGPRTQRDQELVDEWATYRDEVKAYQARLHAFTRTHRQLEVNHIEPRVGKGYGVGCWNHLDNLETLCAPCHVEVTKQQRRSRQPQLTIEIDV